VAGLDAGCVGVPTVRSGRYGPECPGVGGATVRWAAG
jgi:hypothetical protein